MSNDVERQLVDLLQALQKLKAPGASKGKIADITVLCVDNVKVKLDLRIDNLIAITLTRLPSNMQ